MNEAKQQEDKQKEKLNLFNSIIEVISGVQIAASPFLIGLIIGFVIYLCKPGNMGFFIALLVAVTGLTIGIIWAVRIWKKTGTTNYISQISATPELDNLEEKGE